MYYKIRSVLYVCIFCSFVLFQACADAPCTATENCSPTQAQTTKKTEGKSCSNDKDCLVGYECSEKGTCMDTAGEPSINSDTDVKKADSSTKK